ncbi:MAG: hypothetical protein ABEJ98_02570 [Candidatus Nanohaloarchaea archaeon]
MELGKRLDAEEALSAIWGLVGAYAGNLLAEGYGVAYAVDVFTVTTFFIGSYILADEFIKRMRCER